MGHLGYARVPQSKKCVNFQLVTRLAASLFPAPVSVSSPRVGRSIASGFSARIGSPRSRQIRAQCGIRSPRPQTCTTSSRSVFQHFLGIVAARVDRQAGGVVEHARRLLRAGGSDRHEGESGNMLECRCVGLPVSREPISPSRMASLSLGRSGQVREINRLPAMQKRSGL
jgi:hypothetical protein